jgi:hypothetical protein
MRSLSYVGQDGILRAGWQPALRCFHAAKRVNNPLQVANLPHKKHPVQVIPNV